MSFKPIFSFYLLSGTGIDAQNSIWWHRWAYSADPGSGQGWWSNCYRWFKSHSIGHGTWYAMHIDPMAGTLRVGRTPLKQPLDDPVTADGEIGVVAMEDKMNDVTIPFSDVIANVDYLIFQGDNENGGITPVYYCFVDAIRYINWNVAEVSYTCDALMTYQKQFCFGKCSVTRDMQHHDYTDYTTKQIDINNINTEDEPFQINEDDMIASEINDDTLADLTDLGAYGAQFITSDVNLSSVDFISTNAFNPAFPAFEPSGATTGYGSSMLGIGLYYLPRRQCQVLKVLGGYNAMEHILTTYAVPFKLVNENYRQITDSGSELDNPKFIQDVNVAQNLEYDTKYFQVKLWDKMADFQQTSTFATVTRGQGVQPLNPKCLTAPYNYLCISDKQGNSYELAPQLLTNVPFEADHNFIYNIRFAPAIAPQVMSALYCENFLSTHGGQFDPMLTLWQIQCYAMTPNNSGYILTEMDLQKTTNTALKQFGIGALLNVAGTAALLNPTSTIVSETLGIRSVGGGFMGSAVASTNNAMATAQNIHYDKTFGLPGVTGGTSKGYSRLTLDKVGYVFFQVHLRRTKMENIDKMFSIYGYAQNKWRFPHINTRRRWTFVQCSDVSIIPIQADDQNKGGVPFWARQQIVERMQKGVTFWNIRQAMMGDEDGTNAPPTFSEYDSPITDCNFMKFVKRYGDYYDSIEMKENAGLEKVGYPGMTEYNDDIDTEE